jgi:hypothetical protein
MKNIALLATTGLIAILLFDDQVQAQKSKPYAGGPVSFVSFIPSQWPTDRPYAFRKDHYSIPPEMRRHIMNHQGPAALQNHRATAYIIPGPHHQVVGSSKNLQDYIIRKFSWNMVFK